MGVCQHLHPRTEREQEGRSDPTTEQVEPDICEHDATNDQQTRLDAADFVEDPVQSRAESLAIAPDERGKPEVDEDDTDMEEVEQEDEGPVFVAQQRARQHDVNHDTEQEIDGISTGEPQRVPLRHHLPASHSSTCQLQQALVQCLGRHLPTELRLRVTPRLPAQFSTLGQHLQHSLTPGVGR